jgi:hypothetical protein
MRISEKGLISMKGDKVEEKSNANGATTGEKMKNKEYEKNTSSADRWRSADDLAEAALVDTVYGDLYLQRAEYDSDHAARFAVVQRRRLEAVG